MTPSLALPIILLLVLTAAPAIGLQDPPKPASPLTLTATLDRADGKYVLLDEIQIEVKLENTGEKALEVTELAYEEGSLSFAVKAEYAGGAIKEFLLTHIRPDPHVKVRLAPSRVSLAPKKSLTFARRFPTIAPGKFAITANFHNDGANVAAAAVTAEVAGATGGNKLVATVTTASHGAFSFELRGQDTPANVSNFVELARRGFYKDMLFNRVVPKHWVQAGCPYGLGIGGPGYSVKPELEDTVRHEEGTVSMAGFEKTGFHGSQFFICLGPQPALDKKYTVIGKVAADQIEAVRTIGKVTSDKITERPTTDVRITDITITVKN